MTEMSESEVGLPYRGWERFFAAVGSGYHRALAQAMARVKAELAGAEVEELVSLAREARATAASLDEAGARLTVRLHEERDRHAGLAASLEEEAEQLLQRAPRGWSPRRRAERREARRQALEQGERAAAHHQKAAEAQEQIRALDQQGRLFAWFEKHRDTLARGLAAEQLLSTDDWAAYHVLGAPSIASPTAACLTAERAIDLTELGELVDRQGNERQRLLLDVAIELRSGSEREVTLAELVEQLHGEDLDRVLEGIAIRRRRALRGVRSPTDLWIRAAEPECEQAE